MASLAQLYKKAKAAGHSASEIRGKSADEIQELLSSGKGKTAAKKKTPAKKKVATPVAKKKRGRPVGSKNKTKAATKATAPAKKRGRPKGSTNKAKATTTKAKAKSSSNGNGDGRHLLSKINYSKADGWNPREGSAPDRIVKALKRFKGDREKVFNHLKADVWEFVGKTKRNGDKRTKDEALEMLAYRIARTDWQFAIATGQHEVATDRVEYGTGGTGQGTFKRGKAAPAKKSSGKRGRPAKAQKASKASKSNGPVNPKEMSDQALRKYLKSFEGKRGRRPAEYAVAVKQAKRRKLNV